MSTCKMPVNSEASFEVGSESADLSATGKVDDEFESDKQESARRETEDATSTKLTNSCCCRISDRLEMDIQEQPIYFIGKRCKSKMRDEAAFSEGKSRRRRSRSNNNSNSSIHRKKWRSVTADETSFNFSLLPRRAASETDEQLTISESDNGEGEERFRPSLTTDDASARCSSTEVDTFVNMSEISVTDDALSVACIWLRREDNCDRCFGSTECSRCSDSVYDGNEYEEISATTDRLKRSNVHRFRQKKKWRVEKARLQVKTKHCRTLSNSVHGVLLFINHRVLKRMEMEVGREQGLLPIKRKDKVTDFPVKNRPQVSSPNPKYLRKSPSTSMEDAQQLLYAVGTDSADSALSADVVSLLLELQHRDLFRMCIRKQCNEHLAKQK